MALIMRQASITIRVEPSLKKNFDSLCEDFGLSVTAAFNLFMKAVVRERCIPFRIHTDDDKKSKEEVQNNAKKALSEMRRIIAESGQEEMSLEAINQLIREVRDERRL